MCQVCGPGACISRRAIGLFAISGLLLTSASAKEKESKPPKPENVLSPEDSLERLLEGNERYAEGEMRRHDFKREREALTGGQIPFAAILSCADSRITPEYAFDSGRGDLFVCRVAGNFASDETVASLEYAVAVLNTPLILVLGHDACGAVDATIKSLKEDKPPPRTHSLAGHSHCAVRQSGFLTERGYTQRRVPTEHHRQCSEAEISGANPWCRCRRKKAEGRRRRLPAEKRKS